MTIDINALFVLETAASLLRKGLDLAQAVGLPVTSWRPGDPTLAIYKHLATQLGARDQQNVDFIKAGFLSTATGDWLPVVSSEVYGIDQVEATPSTPTVTLHNGAGGFFPIGPGDLTMKSSTSGATFHNTDDHSSTDILSAGRTVTFALVADEPGSGGTVALDEVDSLVTTLLGVTVVSSTASIGVDVQDETSLKQDCADTLGALSPDGPPDAYEYVARRSELTGVLTVTRSASVADSGLGTVTLYVAGPNGAVDGASVTAVQNAIEIWATPLCITPTTISASNLVVNIVATVSGDDVPADFEAVLTAALSSYMATLKIAKGAGLKVSHSKLEAQFYKTLALDDVVLSTPAADVPYFEGQVPVIGTVSITEV